jgi:chitodextrinase
MLRQFLFGFSIWAASLLLTLPAGAQSTGLVAAYGFNDSASAYADSSGNGNNGTCPSGSCPEYLATGGRYGDGALSFPTLGRYVELPNESSFDFTKTFTVSLWVKSNGFSSSWEALVAKGDSAWGLSRYGTTRAATFTTFSPSADDARGTKTIDDGLWHHIAAVYDGTTKKLYVDGTLDAQRSFSQSIRNNNLKVRIGHNQEYTSASFRGILDDVRVYSRALSQNEILADLSTPVKVGATAPPVDPGVPAVDRTPPLGTLSINAGAVATNSRSVVLSLSATDNAGTVRSMRFSNSGSSFSTGEPYATAKTWVLSSGSGTKTVYGQFEDAAGNWSAAVSATIQLDVTLPTISSVSVQAITSSSARVTWATNEGTTSKVEYGTSLSYGSLSPASTILAMSHVATLTGLTPGTLYHFRVRAQDAAGNEQTTGDRTFTTTSATDLVAPSTPSGLSASPSATSVTLAWSASSDNVGVRGYRVFRGQSLVATTAALSFTDTGLDNETTYAYGVEAYDTAGNTSERSTVSTETLAAPISSEKSFAASLSSNGRYVVDHDGRPFFMNGDTAWSLIVQLSREEAAAYLEDRAKKGVNLVLVNLIDIKFGARAPANYYGDQPFLSPGNFSTPNENYFAHADWVINKAADLGITVLLAPVYLGYNCGDQGWCTQVRNNSTASMRSYGRYLGSRYKGAANIVWLIGGDTDPVAQGVGTKIREFVAGLKEEDPVHLISAHNGPEQSARDVWSSDAWLDLNNVYTYSDAYPDALAEYAKTPFKPLFLIETYYEHEHNSTPLSLRRQAYSSVLSGANLGHIFGNCEIWGFSEGFCSGAWQPQLNSTGSQTIALVGKLFKSRAFHTLVPDSSHQVLVNGYQSGSTYAAAARTSDGTTIIAYIPTRRTVTVNLAAINGATARAWWFNPRTSASTLIGEFATGASQSFTPPDQNDWVLVIDDVSENLSAPGQSGQ